MIRELVELAKRNREKDVKNGKIVHNAIKKENVNMLLHINNSGTFIKFEILEEAAITICEAIAAKKGKARLLVDKLEETLGILSFDEKAKRKHELYLDKLLEYESVRTLKPVLDFFNSNKKSGVESAVRAVQEDIDSRISEEVQELEEKSNKKGSKFLPEEAAKTKVKKVFQGNIAFFFSDQMINASEIVLDAVVEQYEKQQTKFERKKCSVCGSDKHPVEDIPHGMVKRVPNGQSSGCAFVSFNENSFESYDLKGNLNSHICTNCARAYVDSLNWLLAPSGFTKTEKGKDKPVFNNRYDIGSDTASVFWTKEESSFSLRSVLDASNAHDVKALFQSLRSGKKASIAANEFYAITLSGSAARIMVRDYIRTSLGNIQSNLGKWFADIDIGRKDGASIALYTPLWLMAESTRRPNDSKRNDLTPSRVQAILWKAAIQGTPVPLWPLHAVISRIRMESYNITEKLKSGTDSSDSGSLSFSQVFSPARIALIKLVLNRIEQGEKIMKEHNVQSTNVAYNCGCIFAVLAKIQYHAAKRDLNVGVVNQHYSAASTTPSSAFGRLFKNARHHLDKIAGANKGLSVNLDREISELMNMVGNQFPQVLSLEEQGRFALGFYQQRDADFKRKIDVGGIYSEESENENADGSHE